MPTSVMAVAVKNIISEIVHYWRKDDKCRGEEDVEQDKGVGVS